MKTNPTGRSWKKKLLITLSVILGFILALLLTATLIINSMLNNINRVQPDETPISQEEIDRILAETDPPEAGEGLQHIKPEDLTVPTEPAEVIEEEDHIINILLIGQDRRGSGMRARSDAMILCTVDTQKKTLVMTSFLRDLYVPLPDYNGQSFGSNRLNATYCFGGMEMLDECLEMNFGVKVDYNIEVDFDGFRQVIDIMGGVDIPLTAAEAAHIGHGLKEGMNHLNGDLALTYSRIRYLDSDFGRTNRQRTVLLALLEQVRYMNLDQITAIINTVFPLLTTDMTNAEIVANAVKFFPLLKDLKVSTQRIPAEGAYYAAFIDGMAVLVPDLEKNRDILKQTLG